MASCLTMPDVTRLNREPIENLRSTGSSLDPEAEDSCETFARHVITVEAVLRQTYRQAALLAKRAESLQQEAEVWKGMREYSELVMSALQKLKDTYPGCGTPELYNLALDYRAAADERFTLTKEATQCQTSPMPDGLFPRTT